MRYMHSNAPYTIMLNSRSSLFLCMTEEISVAHYCEVCGLDIDATTNLKRFGKLFCTEEHMNQYVLARQKKLGIVEDRSEEDYSERRHRREKSWSC